MTEQQLVQRSVDWMYSALHRLYFGSWRDREAWNLLTLLARHVCGYFGVTVSKKSLPINDTLSAVGVYLEGALAPSARVETRKEWLLKAARLVLEMGTESS